jgi:alpha-glucosidase
LGSSEWWREAVFYQIYVRSFHDTDGDGIGDIPGIIEKLDYLESLGVGALWLTPIHPSPDRDFGYDVSDYLSIHPAYGSMEDFERLLEAAHARGLRVILDFVLNHTSREHAWFADSRSSLDSPRRDWYIWREGRPGGKPPNRWMNRVYGSAWERDPRTGQYYYHAFFREQPDLNWRNPEVRRAMFDAARFWLDKGVDGFRLDLVNHLVEDAQLRDNPRHNPLKGWKSLQQLVPYEWQEHLWDRDQPETHAALKELREVVDAYPGRVLVGEAATFDPAAAASFYGGSLDELHLVFNFDFFTCACKAEEILQAVDKWQKALPPGAWPCLALSNHDQARHAGRYGGSFMAYGASRFAPYRARLAAALLLTLQGTPFLYYGEEIGMPNALVWPWEVRDPAGRIAWPLFQGRDMARTPMRWDASPRAGFSTGRPWLKLGPGVKECNAATQEADHQSLLNFYRELMRLRKERPALSRGSQRFITQAPRGSLVYLREHGDDAVLVALNFLPVVNTMSTLRDGPLPERFSRPRVLASSYGREREAAGPAGLRLLPHEALLLTPLK